MNSSISVLDFKRRAYNLIWNEYYRDETLQDPISWRNENILNRSWRKDYFTSSLPFQQRGPASALPVNIIIQNPALQAIFNLQMGQQIDLPGGGSPTTTPVGGAFDGSSPGRILTTPITTSQQINQILSNNTINANNLGLLASTFDVTDLRHIVQLQKWMERNARAGARYNEYIKAHFDEEIGDSRMWRPEYIGGTKTPLIISEVLQTSQTNNTPQGTMAGHGISAQGSQVGTYKCVEFGYINGMLSIMPRPGYTQGIPREDMYETREDWFSPEFVNLSEQEIKNAEIYFNNDQNDNGIFGFQGRYDEFRVAQDEVCGGFRDTLLDWHLNRIFSSRPMLNADFIECKPENTRRIFAQQIDPNILVVAHHINYVSRPLPEIAEPGLVDHH